MVRRDPYAEDKAKDALAFDPLPDRSWLKVTVDGAWISIHTPPEQPFKDLLKKHRPAEMNEIRRNRYDASPSMLIWRFAPTDAGRMRKVIVPALDALHAARDERRAKLKAAEEVAHSQRIAAYEAEAKRRIEQAATGERSGDAWWDAILNASIPGLPAYRLLTDWERRFVQDLAQRRMKFGDSTRLSDKQTETAQRIYDKIKHIIVA